MLQAKLGFLTRCGPQLSDAIPAHKDTLRREAQRIRCPLN